MQNINYLNITLQERKFYLSNKFTSCLSGVLGCCSNDDRNTFSYQWLEWFMFVNYWTAQHFGREFVVLHYPLPRVRPWLRSVDELPPPLGRAATILFQAHISDDSSSVQVWSLFKLSKCQYCHSSNKTNDLHYFGSKYIVILVVNGRHFKKTQNILPFLRTGLIYCTQAPAHQMLLRSVLEFV